MVDVATKFWAFTWPSLVRLPFTSMAKAATEEVAYVLGEEVAIYSAEEMERKDQGFDTPEASSRVSWGLVLVETSRIH